MKKVVLILGVAAIVVVAAFNLNLAINRESKANVSSKSIFSVAQNEDETGNCETYSSSFPMGECSMVFNYWCGPGFSYFCEQGTSEWVCYYHLIFDVKIIKCTQKE